MKNLKNLFDRLDNIAYCKFYENKIYHFEKNGHIKKLTSKEMLEIGSLYSNKEQVVIANFGELPTRISYFGENVRTMKKTLHNLKLPKSWSSNLGEKVFYLFNGHLEDIKTGPIYLEQKVISGKEHQFEMVFKKLIQYYQNSK
jgi:hypothetical protein